MGIKVTIANNPSNRVAIDTLPTRKVAMNFGAGGGGSANYLGQLLDVNDDDVDNGETLVWDEATQKYVIKAIPEIDGGTF